MDPQAPAQQPVTDVPVTPPQAPAPSPTANSAPAVPDHGTELPSVPGAWPGAFGAYKFSKAAIQFNPVTIVGIWLLGAILSGLLRAELKNSGQALSSILEVLFMGAVAFVMIAGVRRQKLGFADTLKKALPLWLKLLGLTILNLLIIVISLLLLVIPFFFVAPRLILATYFLVDKELGVVESLKASWHTTKGHVGKVYGIFGATLAMFILAFTIIGIPFAIYFLVMYSAAFVVLYEFLQQHPSTAQTTTVSTTAPQPVPPVAPVAPAPASSDSAPQSPTAV